MADEPEIVVVVEPISSPSIHVTVSEVGLVGPPGDPMPLVDQVIARLEPPVDLVILLENAMT
jgi:hypothetical protein